MIVFPMAGLSSRFSKAGYSKPKYMLTIEGATVFDKVIEGFSNYFNKEKFIFILQEDQVNRTFIERTIQAQGIENYEIIGLAGSTKGQAETVYLGLKKMKETEGSLTIFNIDTFRPAFEYPEWISEVDGYLETFNGEGSNWSTISYIGSNVTKVVEKQRLSEQCCTGLYYWSRVSDFFDCFEEYLTMPDHELVNGEYYIAPMYNYLISKIKKIKFNEISKENVIFCGTPLEYEALVLK